MSEAGRLRKAVNGLGLLIPATMVRLGVTSLHALAALTLPRRYR